MLTTPADKRDMATLEGRDQQPEGQGRGVVAWLTVITLGLILRGGILWGMADQMEADPDAYRQLALTWQRTGQFSLPNNGATDIADAPDPALAWRPTAYRPPLYPLVLSWLFRSGINPNTCVVLLHLALGLATVAATYALARWWFTPTFAGLAAILVAADPILLFQSVQVMTETLATLLALLTLIVWGKSRKDDWMIGFWWSGLLLGLAMLCRPPFLLWSLGLLGLTLLGYAWQGQPRRACAAAGLLVLANGLVVAPWAYRNWQVFGEPRVTTTHGGYTLLLANNPSFYSALERGEPLGTWGAEDPEFQAILRDAYAGPVSTAADEAAQDRALAAFAWQTIHHHPGLFWRSCVVRALWFWSPLPQRTADESPRRSWLRGAVAAFYGLEYLLAGVAIWFGLRPFSARGSWLRSPSSARLIFSAWLLLAVALAGLHTVYWSNMRMRAPLVPGLALLAAAGAWGLSNWAAGDRRPKSSRFPAESAAEAD